MTSSPHRHSKSSYNYVSSVLCGRPTRAGRFDSSAPGRRHTLPCANQTESHYRSTSAICTRKQGRQTLCKTKFSFTLLYVAPARHFGPCWNTNSPMTQNVISWRKSSISCFQIFLNESIPLRNREILKRQEVFHCLIHI